MELLRLVVIGLVVFTLLVLGVVRGNRVNEPGDRERLDKLLSKGNFGSDPRKLKNAESCLEFQ